MGFLTDLFGGGAPQVSTAPLEEVKKDAAKAKKSRSALLSTEGGIAGQELLSGQVGNPSSNKRDTLLGN